MTIRLTALTLIAAFAMPTLAHAGGPVLVEDMTETAPIVQDRKGIPPWLIAVIAIAVVGAIACNGPDDVPPSDGGC